MRPLARHWHFRDAVEADREALFQLYALTMGPVVDATWGWDEAWQRADFDRRLRSYSMQIIERRSDVLGAVCFEWSDQRLYLHELQLFPDYQGRGMGAEVVSALLQRAAARALPMDLSVVLANPRAKRFYERLGFRVVTTESPFIRMRHDGVSGL